MEFIMKPVSATKKKRRDIPAAKFKDCPVYITGQTRA